MPKTRTSFAKGRSGNPGGRPKEHPEIRELAKQRCPRAIERLTEIMESSDERAASAAAKELLDRGIGKAPQHITSETHITGDSTLSLSEVNALIAECRAMLGGK